MNVIKGASSLAFLTNDGKLNRVAWSVRHERGAAGTEERAERMGCICKGGESPVISKTKRGAANVAIFPG
jgi:hypothetical protein